MKANGPMLDNMTAQLASAGTIFLSFGHMLPSIATLLAIGWYGTQLWEFTRARRQEKNRATRQPD